MAGTYGNLINRISFESNKTGSEFEQGIKNAIITAIKYMEANYYWLFETEADLTILSGQRSANLPSNFSRLIDAKFQLDNILYGRAQGFVNEPFTTLNSYYSITESSGIPAKYSLYGTQFYVYPQTSSDVTIKLYYNYKDAFYPENDDDSSIWFDEQTCDALRYKAHEIFARDTLQSPEIANQFFSTFLDFKQNLDVKNTNQTINNTLSI